MKNEFNIGGEPPQKPIKNKFEGGGGPPPKPGDETREPRDEMEDIKEELKYRLIVINRIIKDPNCSDEIKKRAQEDKIETKKELVLLKLELLMMGVGNEIKNLENQKNREDKNKEYAEIGARMDEIEETREAHHLDESKNEKDVEIEIKLDKIEKMRNKHRKILKSIVKEPQEPQEPQDKIKNEKEKREYELMVLNYMIQDPNCSDEIKEKVQKDKIEMEKKINLLKLKILITDKEDEIENLKKEDSEENEKNIQRLEKEIEEIQKRYTEINNSINKKTEEEEIPEVIKKNKKTLEIIENKEISQKVNELLNMLEDIVNKEGGIGQFVEGMVEKIHFSEVLKKNMLQTLENETERTDEINKIIEKLREQFSQIGKTHERRIKELENQAKIDAKMIADLTKELEKNQKSEILDKASTKKTEDTEEGQFKKVFQEQENKFKGADVETLLKEAEKIINAAKNDDPIKKRQEFLEIKKKIENKTKENESDFFGKIQIDI